MIYGESWKDIRTIELSLIYKFIETLCHSREEQSKGEGVMIKQTEVYAIKITRDIPKELFNQICRRLTKERQKQIRQFRQYQDGQRSLLAEVLVRRLIHQYTGLQEEEIILRRNQYGKPFLVDMPAFHFNVSHAGEWVLCAIDCLPVGIDVEKIQFLDMDFEEIAQKTFSEVEYQAVLKAPLGERDKVFFELWTLKESYSKAVGKGLSLDLDSFSFQIKEDGQIVFKSKDQAGKWYFKQYEIDKGYKVALCSGRQELPPEIHIWDLDVFLDRLKESRVIISEA